MQKHNVKKVRVLALALMILLLCASIPTASFALNENQNIVIDGKGMIGDKTLSLPKIAETSVYYVYNSQWHQIESNGDEAMCSGKKTPGVTYVYRLMLVFNDPNAYPNDCRIIIKNVDWLSSKSEQGEWDGQRTISFEGTYHAHKGKYIGQIDATCTESGVKGYWLCDCGCRSTDEFGMNPIKDESWFTINPKGHDNEYVAMIAPACEEDGVAEHYHCNRCGKDFDANDESVEITDMVLPATGHTDANDDGKCDDCSLVLSTSDPAIDRETTTNPDGEGNSNVGTPTPIIPQNTTQDKNGITFGWMIVIIAAAFVTGACIAVAVVLIVKNKRK